MNKNTPFKQITIACLEKRKAAGEKFSSLTVYDALMAEVLSTAGVELLLVGDTLGEVFQGHETTVPVTVEDIVYHTQCVHRGNRGALLVADLPFMSYATPTQTFENAARLMQAGAQMVKMEGGAWLTETIAGLSARGIPVCGHLGLMPQSVHAMSGYKVQGRAADQATRLLEEAALLEQAGVRLLVLECVPFALAREVTQAVQMPVIGIGAGPDCDGQILVTPDILGLNRGHVPKFVRQFLGVNAPTIPEAIGAYVQAVKAKTYPGPEEVYE